jgi:hypothetical protein
MIEYSIAAFIVIDNPFSSEVTRSRSGNPPALDKKKGRVFGPPSKKRRSSS